MAINGNTKSAVDTLLTSDTTTETQFKTGLTHITSELDSLEVHVGSLDTWTVEESAGVLYFKVNNVAKMKLDGSGNLTVTGNVTAYGTV